MPDAVLKAEALVKRYANGTLAVDDISFTVNQGEILCLVGPNGAGKTTAVRMSATQLLPTAGSITIFGEDAVKNPWRVRGRMAAVPQDSGPDLELTPWEQVYYYLRTRGLTHPVAHHNATEALQQLGLWEKRRQLCRLLSGGMRRRVLVAMAFATKAELLYLDEPTAGLDPIVRREMWDILSNQRARSTVLLTSHSMEEVEALADRVVVITKGKVRVVGTPRELRRLMPGGHKIIIDNRVTPGNKPTEEQMGAYGRVGTYAGKLVVYPNSDEAVAEAVREALRCQAEAWVQPTNLEDVVVALERGELQ